MIGLAPRAGLRAGTGLAASLRRKLPLRWPESQRSYEGDLVIPDTDRRYAIVTTITDNFVGLGAAFLLSLHEQLANRDEVDVILVQSKDVAPLNTRNRKLLQRLYPGLRVIRVDTASFLNAANMRRYDKEGKPTSIRRDRVELPSKKAAYVKLNVLRLTQYEKVILMDSDMIAVQDFSEIFGLPHDMAATPTGLAEPAFEGAYHRTGGRGFNTGFLLLSRRLRGEGPFNAAIDFLDLKRGKRLRDQSVLNTILKPVEKLLLPHAYNHKLHVGPTVLSDEDALRTAKIIHFVARSKWCLKDPSFAGQAIYDHFHALQKRTRVPFTLEP